MILLKKDAKKVDWPAIQKRLDRMRFENTRAYDPKIGVWLTEDPIGFEAGDFNKKRYVGNDPVNYTDRNGKERMSIDGFSIGNREEYSRGKLEVAIANYKELFSQLKALEENADTLARLESEIKDLQDQSKTILEGAFAFTVFRGLRDPAIANINRELFNKVKEKRLLEKEISGQLEELDLLAETIDRNGDKLDGYISDHAIENGYGVYSGRNNTDTPYVYMTKLYAAQTSREPHHVASIGPSGEDLLAAKWVAGLLRGLIKKSISRSLRPTSNPNPPSQSQPIGSGATNCSPAVVVAKQSRPGLISNNPANKLIETGKVNKDGTWANRWIRMSDEDYMRWTSDRYKYYKHVDDLSNKLRLTPEAGSKFRFEQMQKWRQNWFNNFMENRSY